MVDFPPIQDNNDSLSITDPVIRPTPIDVPPAIQPVSIDNGIAPDVPLHPAVAEDRANKASFGLSPKTDKSKEDFAQAINDGKESVIRADVSNQLDKANIQTAQQILAKGGPDSIDTFLKFTQPTNPATVFEQHYASEYMKHMNWPLQKEQTGSWVKDAAIEIPGQLKKAQDIGSDIGAKNEYLITKLQNATKAIDDQSLLSKAAEFVAGNIPLRADILGRGNVDSVPTQDYINAAGSILETVFGGKAGSVEALKKVGLLGSNIKQQGISLYQKDMPEFTKVVDTIYENLSQHSPQVAASFLQNMLNYSLTDEFNNNAITLLDVSTLPAVPGLAKSTIGAGISFARKASLFNEARMATRSSVYSMGERGMNIVNPDGSVPEGLKDVSPPNVAAPAASGNTAEAGIQNVVNKHVEEVKGHVDAIKDATDALTDNFNIVKNSLNTNPGKDGREIANRISEQVDAVRNLYRETISELYRVNRTPAMSDIEAVYRQAQDSIRDTYKGTDNMVMNISEPLWEPISNRYLVNVSLGNPDGTMLESIQLAHSRANRLGLTVKGEMDNPHAMRKADMESSLILAEDQLDKIKSDADFYKKRAFMGKGVQDAEKILTEHSLSLTEHGVSPHSEEKITNLKNGVAAYKKQLNDTNFKIENLTKGIEHYKSELAKPEYQFSDTGVTVKQQGAGYYLNHVVTLDETAPYTRNNLITTKFGEQSIKQYKTDLKNRAVNTGVAPSRFGGWVNAALGNIRTPEETLSIAENQNRKIATHSPAKLFEVVRKSVNPIEILPKKYQPDFERFLMHGQRAIDPETGKQGKWFNTTEMDNFYQQYLGRRPEAKEIDAYTAYRVSATMDKQLRIGTLIKNKSRVGAAQWSFSYLGDNGKQIQVPYFDAIKMDHLPLGSSDRIVIMGDVLGGEKVFPANAIPDKIQAKLDEMVKQGQITILRSYDPDLPSHPFTFGKAADFRIRYVATNKATQKELSWNNQIPDRGGGHIIPLDNFYIKQADMRRDVIGDSVHWNYMGDNTVVPIRTVAEGKEVATHLNKVRDLLYSHYKGTQPTSEELSRFEGEGGPPGRDYLEMAREYSKNSPLDIPWDELHGWFHGPNTRLSLREPFRVVPKDGSIAGMDKELEDRYNALHKDSFKDRTRQGSDARANVVEFTGERDAHNLMTFKQTGTQDRPIYSYTPADYIDPITAMDRGLVKIVNSTIMEDQKTSAMEHWLQQYKPWLNIEESDLYASPWYHYSKISKQSFKPTTPAKVLMTALNTWKQAQEFNGVRSFIDMTLHGMASDIADSIVKNTNANPLVPFNLLPYVRNPLSYVRSFVFNLDEGLFSPKAMWMQASTYANIYMISPRHAPASTLATFLWTMARRNRFPQTMAHLDNLATKFNIPGLVSFKPGMFTEATKLLDNAGFAMVGDEHAFMMTKLPMHVISNKFNKFIKAGQAPFNLGSGWTRIGGWYTAYLEYRSLNPTGPIGRQDRSAILSRAVQLDNNMSRASASPLHTGPMSIPFQYQAFTLRQTELLTGKTLTMPEKARLIVGSFLAYGARYGALGIGIPLIGGELADALYKNAISNWGYITGANMGADAFMHGLLAVAVAAITGGGDPSKGTYYDIERFGNKGLDPVTETLAGDSVMWKLLSGPLGSHLAGFLRQSQGMVNTITAMIKSDPKSHPFSANDVGDLFKEVASYRAAWQLGAALMYGDWISKNENKIMPISPANAWLMAIVGVHPQEGIDVYTKEKIMSDKKEIEKHLEERFIEERHRGIQEDINGNQEEARKFFIRAYTIMDNIPEISRPSVTARANKFDEYSLDKVDWELYGPKYLNDRNAFAKQLQLRQGRK